MKTEEECDNLAREIHRLVDNACSDEDERKGMLRLRAFQLEAIMEGMTEAAHIIGDDAILQKRVSNWGLLAEKRDAILAARDAKTL